MSIFVKFDEYSEKCDTKGARVFFANISLIELFQVFFLAWQFLFVFTLFMKFLSIMFICI